jgi:hypothetical protein
VRYARSAFAIIPSDTADLPAMTTAGINVGVAGTITLTTEDGATVQVTAVVGLLPIIARRVFATGTAATSLTGFRV